MNGFYFHSSLTYGFIFGYLNTSNKMHLPKEFRNLMLLEIPKSKIRVYCDFWVDLKKQQRSGC